MTALIGLQLYSVREELSRDFSGVIKQIAKFGYAGVETAGFKNVTAKEAARIFSDFGLQVSSAHTPMPLGETKNEALDRVKALGCSRMIGGRGPKDFETVELIRKSCDAFNEAATVAAENNLTFGIHNHWWEFLRVEGKPVYRIMQDMLDPRIFFQIDTYWVQTAGMDPTAVVKELGERAPLLHITEGLGHGK
ncbi:MAG: sugar phosphate isomerase/epimerase [Planctomycetota bacterium]